MRAQGPTASSGGLAPLQIAGGAVLIPAFRPPPSELAKAVKEAFGKLRTTGSLQRIKWRVPKRRVAEVHRIPLVGEGGARFTALVPRQNPPSRFWLERTVAGRTEVSSSSFVLPRAPAVAGTEPLTPDNVRRLRAAFEAALSRGLAFEPLRPKLQAELVPVRVLLRIEPGNDGFTYEALVPTRDARGRSFDPNEASQFYVARSGGLYPRPMQAGPLPLK